MSRVYQVGFVGNSISRFPSQEDQDSCRQDVRRTVLEIMDQYYPNPVCINVMGNAGVGFWTVEACLEYDIDYHLFLPCLPDAWIENLPLNQVIQGSKFVERCSGLTVSKPVLSKDSVREAAKVLTDTSDFLVAFSLGHLSGLTYETIVYALDNSKIILDGFNNLGLVKKKRFYESQIGE